MCGIAGIWGGIANRERVVEQMSESLVHRGPDSSGVWSDTAKGICLGHRRLAIIGLDKSGHQPQSSSSGRYVISYNGEIYNHREIRDLLDKTWHGSSDTETILAALDKWGFPEVLEKLDGMFAMGIWDKELQKLYLVRDPFGEKPLCFGRIGDATVFASELGAITSNFASHLTVDPMSVSQFLAHTSIPAPRTIYRELQKIQPAHYVEISDSGNSYSEQQRYWSQRIGAPVDSHSHTYENKDDCKQMLKNVLERVVPSRLISDRPLGAFLSGGIDSSLVTALLQTKRQDPIKTFSIGFHDQTMDEAPFAKAIANHLRTDHTEFYVSDVDALKTVESLSTLWDEPFADSSQIPTYLLSVLTKSEVTVAISGDGGDELFGGYQRYYEALRIWNQLTKYPSALRIGSASLNRLLHGFVRQSDKFLPSWSSNAVMKKIKAAGVLTRLATSKSFEEFYSRLMLIDSDNYAPVTADLDIAVKGESVTNLKYMMEQDLNRYLPDTILTKVDRASMAVSLETRAPLLNKEIAQLAWSMPDSVCLANGQGKWILREILYDHVPRDLLDRPKKGFSVPMKQWLDGPLKEWAEDLLQPSLLASHDLLDTRQVSAMWNQQKKGQWDWKQNLWPILMLQSWLQSHESISNKALR